MAGKGSTYAYDQLALTLNARALSSVWLTSGTVGTLHVALHTADPAAGDQQTSEVSYTGYGRVATTRTTSTGGWSVSTPTSANATASPVSAITFGQNTSTSTGTITHFSVGLSSGGASKILYSGTVSPNISFQQNTTPVLTTGSSITED